MCTILIFNQVADDFPVILAANRDEFLTRPSTPPLVLWEEPLAIGGKDIEKGGSWMGATAEGFFVGLTNHRTHNPADSGRRSRGPVVSEALRQGSVERAEAYLRGLKSDDYNPFNLLFGDATCLKVAYARSDTSSLVIHDVPQGLHVLPNDVLNAPTYPKVERALSLIRHIPALPWEQKVQELQKALSDRQLPAVEEILEPPEGSPFTRTLLHQLQAICVDLPGYGSRSSTIVALDVGQTVHYLHAEGSPQAHAFESYHRLFGRDSGSNCEGVPLP